MVGMRFSIGNVVSRVGCLVGILELLGRVGWRLLAKRRARVGSECSLCGTVCLLLADMILQSYGSVGFSQRIHVVSYSLDLLRGSAETATTRCWSNLYNATFQRHRYLFNQNWAGKNHVVSI